MKTHGNILFLRRGGHSRTTIPTDPFHYFSLPEANIVATPFRIPRTGEGLLAAVKARRSADAIVVSGGILNGAEFAKDFEFWRAAQAPLILWGGGVEPRITETLTDRPFPLEALHQIRSFALIGLRDFGLGFRWVPCPSCMHEVFDEPQSGKGIVIVCKPETASKIRTHEPVRFQSMDASEFEIIRSLKHAEIVVTDSTRTAYWAGLLGKRTVAIGRQKKLGLLRHPPTPATDIAWLDAIEQTKRYPGALDEARRANLDFFHQVRHLVGSSTHAGGYRRDPVAEYRNDFPLKLPAPALTTHVVPRILHFIFGLAPDFGGKPFNMMHRVAVLSAVARIKPEQVFFHCREIPQNSAFEAVRQYLTIARLPPRSDDMPLHFAHQSDVIRLRILHEMGGIYLDLDTITVATFDPLLVHPFTIGVQGRTQVDGLCNAVLLAAPKHSFVKAWLDTYSRFVDSWDLFSVRLPYAMWRSGRWPANVEPYDVFHWPTWRPGGLKALFERDVQFPNARCHHLWESHSYDRYFDGDGPIDKVSFRNSTYGRLSRLYV